MTPKVAALSIFLFLHCVAPALSADAWALRQNSGEWGIVQSSMSSSKGVRMETKDYLILILVPSYDLVIIDKDAKRYLEQPVEGFNKLETEDKLRKKGWLVKTGKTEVLAGHKIQQININKADAAYSIELWTTKDLGTSEDLNNACLRFLCMQEIPLGSGLPVRVVKHTYVMNGRGQKVETPHPYNVLQTIDIKPGKLMAADLKIPSGLTRVKSMVDLMVESDDLDSTAPDRRSTKP